MVHQRKPNIIVSCEPDSGPKSFVPIMISPFVDPVTKTMQKNMSRGFWPEANISVVMLLQSLS